MVDYRIIKITGGTGFKVHVTHLAGGLRVIGIFLSETEAMSWIADDRTTTSLDEPAARLSLASVMPEIA